MESPAACPDAPGAAGRRDSPEQPSASRSTVIVIVLPGRRFPDRLCGGLARRRRIPGWLTRTAIR